jgi:hypothetical protein
MSKSFYDYVENRIVENVDYNRISEIVNQHIANKGYVTAEDLQEAWFGAPQMDRLLGRYVGGAARMAGDLGGKAAGAAGQGAGFVGNAFKNVGQGVASGIGNAAKSAANAAGQGAGFVGNSFKNVGQGVASGVGSAANAVGDAAGRGLNALGKAAGEGMDRVGKWAGSHMNAAETARAIAQLNDRQPELMSNPLFKRLSPQEQNMLKGLFDKMKSHKIG